MQDAIDNCVSSYSAQNSVKNLWSHLDKFAYEMDIIEKMYSQITTVTLSPSEKEARTPFSDEQIEALWKLQGQAWSNIVLLYMYTGCLLYTSSISGRNRQNTTSFFSASIT